MELAENLNDVYVYGPISVMPSYARRTLLEQEEMKVWILEVYDGADWNMYGVYKSSTTPQELVEEMELEEDDYMIYEQELLD